jgi:predicted DNA-binding WGR domain protein
MIIQPYRLYVERTDVARNMARFYAMSIEPTLFGKACLTRRWGRIGTSGQMMSHHFETEDEAVILFLDLLRQKRRRGYSAVVHGSCSDGKNGDRVGDKRSIGRQNGLCTQRPSLYIVCRPALSLAQFFRM